MTRAIICTYLTSVLMREELWIKKHPENVPAYLAYLAVNSRSGKAVTGANTVCEMEAHGEGILDSVIVRANKPQY